MGISENLKKGTSELLILYLLQNDDMYGYQIAQELKVRSGEQFVMPEGSLYPTLYRLIEKGVFPEEEREKWLKEIVAFANTDGGKVFFGFDDDKFGTHM